MQTSPFHAMYYTKRLRSFVWGDDMLLPAFAATANLEIHPHQVEAALFALRSSRLKGVILADETGLGKSVEALLVMAQKWYEGKQRILLIVPTHLLYQWTQEFEDKLLLPHVSMDNNSIFNNFVKDGQANPFSQEAIVVTTYDFVAEKSEYISDVDWDVTVFEEAHRLRKVYTGENKGAAVIQAAVKGSYKILLTATPMQNNILDLYGLINFIDENEFTDEETFKLRYMNSVENMDELAARVRQICFRTMRYQIKHTVKNPERIPITAEYILTEDEQLLYDKLFSYIKRPFRYAYPKWSEYDLMMSLTRTFSSSTFALTEMLIPATQRLEELYAETNKPDVKSELTHLSGILELCQSIEVNAKGTALLSVLENAFAKLKTMSANRKALIFTENRTTQKYLYDLLNAGKYKGKVLTFNGDKSRDFGVIEAFEKSATMLIATDLAAEGFNMAFCSLVVHYDLPYNVQRIEQRIGRCHRNGQKCDVLSVSFLNENNFADVRMLQLINKRLLAFQGMFGASDDIIGNFSAEFEESMAKIMSLARSKADVEKAFTEIQKKYDDEIQTIAKQAKTSLFSSFDAEIYKSVRLTPDYVRDMTNEINDMLWAVTKYFFDKNLDVRLIDETRTVKIILNPKKMFTGTRLGRNEYSIDDTTLPKSGRHTLAGTLAKNILSELDWHGIPESGTVAVEYDEPQFDRCTIGFYRIAVKRNFAESDYYYEFAGETIDGTRLSDEKCREIMELLVVAVSASGQVIGDRNRHTTHQAAHRLDDFINAAPYIDKTRVRLDSDYAAELERLDYRCMEEKLRLDIVLTELRQRLKRIEKESTEAATAFERLNAQKNKVKTIQEMKKQERSLFMDKMIIEKKYEDAKTELRDNAGLETKITRLFYINASLKNREGE